MSLEDQVRQQMEQDISAAFSIAYPRSEGLREFARGSKRLKKLGAKGFRPKAGQRPKPPTPPTGM